MAYASSNHLPTKRYEFQQDTPVNPNHVGRAHFGLMQLRSQNGGKMESYFPKGTVIEITDYEALGATVTSKESQQLTELDKPLETPSEAQ